MTADQIRKVLANMTPGPWTVVPNEDGSTWYIAPPGGNEDAPDPPIADLIDNKNNACGIALSSTLQPLLFEVFESLIALAEHIKPGNGQEILFKRLDDALQAVHLFEHPEF